MTTPLTPLAGHFRDALDLPPHAADAVTGWVALAHLHALGDAVLAAPLLVVCGADPEAVAFGIELLHGTLPNRTEALVETTPAAHKALAGVASAILIPDLEGRLPRPFLRHLALSCRRTSSFFVPAAVGLVGELPRVWRAWAVPIRVHPARDGRPSEEGLVALATDVWDWIKEEHERIEAAVPELPSDLQFPHAFTWRSIFAIGEAAGGDWPKRLEIAARLLLRRTPREEEDIAVLADVRELVRLHGIVERDEEGLGRIKSALLAEQLHAHFDWPKSQKWLSERLRFAEIAPKAMAWRGSPTRLRGYLLDHLERGWRRYLPGEREWAPVEKEQDESAREPLHPQLASPVRWPEEIATGELRDNGRLAELFRLAVAARFAKESNRLTFVADAEMHLREYGEDAGRRFAARVARPDNRWFGISAGDFGKARRRLEAPERVPTNRSPARARFEYRPRTYEQVIAQLVDPDSIRQEDLTDGLRTHSLFLAACKERLVPVGDEEKFWAVVAMAQRRATMKGRRRVRSPEAFVAWALRNWAKIKRIPKKDIREGDRRFEGFVRASAEGV